MHPWLFRLVLVVALAAGASAAASAAAPAPYTGPVVAGQLTAPPKGETSGLAVSRASADLLWTHDDSGGRAELYAVDTTGRARGTLQIGGVKNEDWEDVAAGRLDGKSWLIIGDIGDNDAKRRELAIHFVPEPTLAQLSVAGILAERPVATLRLRYADGPRDCESLALDEGERALYLLTKRDATPRLYRVALPSPLVSGAVTAQFVGLVPHLPQPTAEQLKLKGHLGKRRMQPCAMDFATDGSAAVVLTYGDLVVFPRQPGESWGHALGRPPVRLAPHSLPQAEAVAFTPDGRQILVASEGVRTLLRYSQP
jgi:hypothetical protein